MRKNKGNELAAKLGIAASRGIEAVIKAKLIAAVAKAISLALITILKQCERELKDFPEEVRGDLADALARLDEGLNLSMPLSRPMPSIGHGVHELRFRDRSGIYRVIYFIRKANDIWLIHAFKKKSQKTPNEDIELARQRLRSLK